MIPQFPELRALRRDDKSIVDSFTRRFPPYSDFNFSGLWYSDVDGLKRISILDDSLIVRFSDYITGDLFYSVLGTKVSDRSLGLILEHSIRDGAAPYLKLIPGEALNDKSQFCMEEDRDNFDYIFAIDGLTSYEGRRLGNQRRFVNRLKKRENITARHLDLNDCRDRSQIFDLVDVWRLKKQLDTADTRNEDQSLARLLEYDWICDFVTTGVFEQERLIGFTISEVINAEFAVVHFEKADTMYEGVYPFLKQQNAIRLARLGCRYINYEQDLGISGLRVSKMRYNPHLLLKKYRIHFSGNEEPHSVAEASLSCNPMSRNTAIGS